MDILYYSNFCKHSQNVLQVLVKGDMKEKITFISIDKRKKDPKTNQVHIQLENGTYSLMPPNVHSVPSLLLINQNYKVIYGDDIITHYQPDIQKRNNLATKNNGEPMGFYLGTSSGGTNILSEKYTDYSMTPEELSAKGTGNTRKLYNYVGIGDNFFIETPPDDYKPDKVSGDVTVDSIQQKRMQDVISSTAGPDFLNNI